MKATSSRYVLDSNYTYNSYHTNSYLAAIVASILVEMEFRDVRFSWRKETGDWENLEKTLGERGDKQQTLPRYG